MACSGTNGDYLCDGWRTRAAAVVARDGGRCRGCDRTAEEARLEVHHRRYGRQGPCGSCVLTSVDDDDLVTLCGGPDGCHDAITNVRRALRYAGRSVEPALVEDQQPRRPVAAVRIEITVEPITAPAPRGTVAARRAGTW